MASFCVLFQWMVVILLSLSAVHFCHAGDDTPDTEAIEGIKYRNPAERREAGLGTQLSPNVRLFGLLEYETLDIRHPEGYRTGQNLREDTYTGQLALQLQPAPWLKAEIVAEIEKDDNTNSKLDEAFAEIDLDVVEVSAGRLYVPFGEYYSYFISGPILEFGETSGPAVLVDIDLTETLELQLYGLRNDVPQPDSRARKNQWGANVSHANPTETFLMAAGYLSDMRAADDGLIKDLAEEQHTSPVGGVNASLLWQIAHTQLTFEYVAAVESLQDDGTSYTPRAYNSELTYFHRDRFQISVRYERAFDMGEDLRRQYGISASYSPLDFVTMTCEYLRGYYPHRAIGQEPDDFDDDDDEATAAEFSALEENYPPVSSASMIGFHISIEF
jgi:hypothetical protein